MTNNISDCLNRIEAIVESNSRAIEATSANLDKLSTELPETKQIANSNSRAIQGMIEQQATDRLRHEEVMAEMRTKWNGRNARHHEKGGRNSEWFNQDSD